MCDTIGNTNTRLYASILRLWVLHSQKWGRQEVIYNGVCVRLPMHNTTSGRDFLFDTSFSLFLPYMHCVFHSGRLQSTNSCGHSLRKVLFREGKFFIIQVNCLSVKGLDVFSFPFHFHFKAIKTRRTLSRKTIFYFLRLHEQTNINELSRTTN